MNAGLYNRTVIIFLTLFLISAISAHAQAPFIPPEIILYTDRQTYTEGEDVIILGLVVDENFRPVAGVEVLITVIDPNGQIILDTEATTNQTGIFTAALRLNQGAEEGEYLITADPAEGDFSPGSRSFLVCNKCPSRPQIAVITTTLPGPTVTVTIITQTTTALTTILRTTTVSQTIATEAPPMGDILSIVFIAVLLAIFGFIIVYSRKF